jgi:hypothetical protein
MRVGRLLGWIVLILGLVVLGRDLIGWIDTHRFEPVTLGQLWVDSDRRSLDFAEMMIRRFATPILWDPVIATMLRLWATALLLVIGGTLLLSSRKREVRVVRRRRR